MARKSAEMSEITSEKSEMSFTAEAVRAEMRQHVSAIAALAPEDNRKAALTFAAKVLRLPFARVKCLFYGEARRIDAHEADQVRAYVQAAQQLIEARADYEAQRIAYLANAHPALVHLAPRPSVPDEISEAAEEAVQPRLKTAI
jgi:hypothetical protein